MTTETKSVLDETLISVRITGTIQRHFNQILYKFIQITVSEYIHSTRYCVTRSGARRDPATVVVGATKLRGVVRYSVGS